MHIKNEDLIIVIEYDIEHREIKMQDESINSPWKKIRYMG